MSDLRDAFEKWYREQHEGVTMKRMVNGDYVAVIQDECWHAWQAALSANGGEAPTWTAEDEPVAYLTWHQVRHAIDDYEDVVALAHKDDRSADGTPAFPVYTHPAPPSVAVPEGWNDDVAELLEQARQLQEAQYGPSAQTLAAAPSPDHSGDANKMVTPERFKAFHAALCRRFGYTHDERYWWRDLVSLEDHIAAKVADHIAGAGKVVPSDWEGWACHKAGKMPRLYGEKSIAEVNCDTENGERLVFLSAAPSVPENEVKARGLEEYADQLDAVFANAQEAGATDCPAWHAGQFAKDARKQAARLRTAGDEGEGHDVRT